MTADVFNSLPLEAREYIQKQKTCLSCGKANDLDAHYKNYLKMKNEQLFTLRIGAVAFKDKQGNGKILYPVQVSDTDEQVREKLGYALALNGVAPDRFSFINVEKIEKYLAENIKSPLKGAAKATAKATADKAAEEIGAKSAAGTGTAETKGDDLV